MSQELPLGSVQCKKHSRAQFYGPINISFVFFMNWFFIMNCLSMQFNCKWIARKYGKLTFEQETF